MSPQSSPNPRLVFGPFELDTKAEVLLKAGTRVRLASQPCRILSVLAAHPGEVVSADDLRRLLWQDGTFVDFEHGLHAAINKLRRALGDSASKPRYVETIPGKGYRFAAAVMHRLPAPKVAEAAPVELVAAAPPKPTPFRSRLNNRRWFLGGISAALAALAALAVLYRPREGSGERVFTLELGPPNEAEFAFGTDSAGLALSPDGQFVAYVASYRGITAVWVRSLSGATARQIAGTEGANLPFWSPDSRSIAFFAANKLQRVEISGGSPQLICDMGLGAAGSWGENGQIIFAGWHSGLYTVSASGGAPKALTTVDGSRQQVFHSWPQFLPGGKFLYFVRSRRREDTGVYAASLTEPQKAVQVLSTETNALYAPRPSGGHRNQGYLLWLSATSLLEQAFNPGTLKLVGVPHRIADPVARLAPRGETLASISANGILTYRASAGVRQFKWVDRAGKPQSTLGEPGITSHFRLSHDGSHVVAIRHNNNGTDLWLLDVRRAVWTRLTSTPGMNIYPLWSPDDREIVFASDAPSNLFRKDVSGGGQQRLTHSPNPQFPMDWSSDGRFILYEQDDPTGEKRTLWILGMQGDAMPRSYNKSPFNTYMGRISPDNRRAVFQSDETGRYEVYMDTFPESHGKVRISTAGGILPRWSAGGHEVLYVAPDFTLMTVRVRLGNQPEVSTPERLFVLPAVDPDLSPYEVSSDGGRFLILEPVRHAESLTVIVNWPTLADAGAPR